jgi:hypothetical protein
MIWYLHKSVMWNITGKYREEMVGGELRAEANKGRP